VFHWSSKMASSGLRLSNQQLPIDLEREQTLNLMSGSLHSTSTIIYHLSIALLMVSHHKMGVTRIKRKINLNANRVSTSSYRPNAQSKIDQKVKVYIKRKGAWLNPLGLTLITTMLASSQLDVSRPPNTHWTCST
jgi:hypothetical protein